MLHTGFDSVDSTIRSCTQPGPLQGLRRVSHVLITHILPLRLPVSLCMVLHLAPCALVVTLSGCPGLLSLSS
jgi:hypothetical protein